MMTRIIHSCQESVSEGEAARGVDFFTSILAKGVFPKSNLNLGDLSTIPHISLQCLP